MGDDAREMMRLLIVAAAVVSVTYAVTTCSNKPADAAAIAVRQEFCPPSAPFFGFMGCAAALVFACLGAAGLCCGMAGLSAGIAIGIVGDAGVRANARQPKLFVGVILILIFAEALGLYGLIVALILSSNTMKCADISEKSCFSAAK